MKTSNRSTTSQTLTAAVDLARVHLTTAETSLKSAKHEFKMAKRRRKEIKEALRLTKKRLRSAKQERAEAKQTLASAEQKLARKKQDAARAKKRAAARGQVKPVVSTAKKKKGAKRSRPAKTAVIAPVPVENEPSAPIPFTAS